MDQHAPSEPDRDITAALRQILQVIGASRDDEAPVFEVILGNACRLCNAPFAGLYLLDPARREITLVASLGARSAYLTGNARRWPIDDPASIGIAIREGRIVQAGDIRDTDAYRQGNRQRVEAADIEGIRTFLAVPLIHAGVTIGAIGLYRREVAPFSDPQIALVETFAAQAVIALENVRQFREVQTRLEREKATREILQVISQSREDDMPVFEKIAEQASRLCDAPLVGLALVGDMRDRIRQVGGVGPRMGQYLPGEEFLITPGSADAAVIEEAQTLHFHDVTQEPDSFGDEENIARMAQLGIRTRLSVPLLLNSQTIGLINLNRTEVRPFSQSEITLVQTFAAQAVIAIENVRQFREVQTRLEREKASREVLDVISRSRDDESPVFDTILENAARLCHAPLAALSLISEDGRHYTFPAMLGANPDFETFIRENPPELDPTRYAAARAMVEGRTLQIDDLSDPALYGATDRTRIQSVAQEGVRTAFYVPLISDGRAIGAICLYRREVRAFSPDDIALAESFAAQAVIAIENVRQFRELEKLNAELETRVDDQVGEIERMGRLKRFLSQAVADAVISAGSEDMLQSHRALIATLFADMRGFTAFCETAEPEETIEVLQTFHEEMGRLIHAHGAGVDSRAGDGIMVIMGDPLPLDDPAGDALNLALAMRDRMAELATGWRRLGHRLGFGVGLSLGYATVGMVGSDGRYDYTASGTAVNLAARLCDHAADGEILLSPRACMAVEDRITAESMGERDFKGIKAPVEVFRVAGPKA